MKTKFFRTINLPVLNDKPFIHPETKERITSQSAISFYIDQQSIAPIYADSHRNSAVWTENLLTPPVYVITPNASLSDIDLSEPIIMETLWTNITNTSWLARHSIKRENGGPIDIKIEFLPRTIQNAKYIKKHYRTTVKGAAIPVGINNTEMMLAKKDIKIDSTLWVDSSIRNPTGSTTFQFLKRIVDLLENMTLFISRLLIYDRLGLPYMNDQWLLSRPKLHEWLANNSVHANSAFNTMLEKKSYHTIPIPNSGTILMHKERVFNFMQLSDTELKDRYKESLFTTLSVCCPIQDISYNKKVLSIRLTKTAVQSIHAVLAPDRPSSLNVEPLQDVVY